MLNRHSTCRSAFDPSRRELTLAPQDEGLLLKPFLHPEEDRRSVSKDQEMGVFRSTHNLFQKIRALGALAVIISLSTNVTSLSAQETSADDPKTNARAAAAMLPPLAPFPDWPEPKTTLSAEDSGKIHFATLSPFDLDVLLQTPEAATPTTGIGTLTLPEGASAEAPVPAMIIVHGSGGISPGREESYADLFAQNGMAGFVIDYYSPRGYVEGTNYMARVLAVTDWDIVADVYGALKVLGTHPAIDASRIGVIGFSYGGMAARHSIDQRFKDALAPDVAPLAAHVDFYGPCHLKLGSTQTTGAPVLTVRGEKDASNDLPACAEREAELRELNVSVEAVIFGGAGHAWENTAPQKMWEGPYVQGCTIAFDDKGHTAIDDRPLPAPPIEATRAERYPARAGLNKELATCVKYGYLVGNDPRTRDRAYEVLLDFLAQQFAPKEATPEETNGSTSEPAAE